MLPAAPETQPAVSIRGHSTLVLDHLHPGWVVESGRVAVFRARIRDGLPVGPRRYCCGCQAGQAVFGDPGSAADDRFRFLVVGIADSQLRPLTGADLDRMLIEAPDSAADLVETWIEKLANFLGQEKSEHAPCGAADGPIQLADGQVFRPAWRTPCWVRIEEGTATLVGLAELQLKASPIPFPLGSEAWLRASGAVRLTVARTTEASAAAALLQGLGLLHALFLAYLKLVDQREAIQEGDRLRDRERAEENATTEALNRLGEVLSPQASGLAGDSGLQKVLAAIGRQLHVNFEAPSRGEDLSRAADPLEAIARASQVRIRHVLLRGEWWNSDCGPLLAYLGDRQHPAALLRNHWGKYEIHDADQKLPQPLTPETRQRLSDQAVMFYRPFPAKLSGLFDIPVFVAQLYWRELLLIIAIGLAATVLGMALPQATALVIDYAIPDSDARALWEFALVLLAVNCGQTAFQLAQGIVMLRLQTAATALLQAAAFDRVLRLPTRFFQSYSSGDLLNRTMMITEVSNEISTTALRSVLSGAMSIFYLGLLFYYSARLAFVGVAAALMVSVVTAALSIAIRRSSIRLEMLSGELFGFVVQALSGVAKVRVAGAERRAFNHWTRRYADQLQLSNQVSWLQDMGQLFSFALPTLFTIVLYFIALGQVSASEAEQSPALSMGRFLAFFTAFGMFVGGASSFCQGVVHLMDSLAKQRLVQPILETAPEFESSRVDPGRLQGGVAVDQAVFRYRADGALILDGVSLTAEPGEFIALVGPSGSGKSTILRLILGFETPESGAVLVDGQNLAGLNLTAVRRQVGVVLQSARITAASLFENIAFGNRISLEEAWQACRDAGLADDIEQMPMGMHTVITEGGGNFSGGQRQRLFIARALVLNPKVLIFDEATSALDNRTQAIVSRSLERRKVTRIVVAHRLSTIRNADRIYVLDRGRVVQAGTFDALAAQEGLFQRMIQRQQT